MEEKDYRRRNRRRRFCFVLLLSVLGTYFLWKRYGTCVWVYAFPTALWCVYLFGALFLYYRKTRGFLRMKIDKVDEMRGEEFEEWIAAHFKRRGYKVTMTAKSHDYGADLLLYKRGHLTVVQAKRYDGNVGVAAVQQACASMRYYEADDCMVVTNSYFTEPAIDLANKNEVELWDRDDLVEQFLS